MSSDGDTSTGSGGQTQAALLVKLARERYRPVLGTDGRAYAVAHAGPNLARPLIGRAGLRSLLARIYADTCQGAVPGSSALSDAITVIEGYARDLTPEPVYLRVAPAGDGVVLDLGDPDGRCVLITPGSGWQRLGSSPVLFRRTALTSALPDPLDVGVDAGLAHLQRLLNVAEDGFRLIVAWLIAAFIPNIAHPILAVFGEQGTAKSTATRMLVELIDPSPAPLRAAPRDVKQWSVTASASWTVALDNCSGFAPWFSDTLCKAVSGDGIVDRALYTDDDVTVMSFRRVIALNGIDAGALRGDLAERLLTVELDRIPTDHRRPESEVLAEYETHRAEILAALLTLLADVLAALPHIHVTDLPRMADFARLLTALDKTTGWDTAATYMATAAGNAAAALDSDPLGSAIRDWMTNRTTWTGTTQELLDALTPERPPKNWPPNPVSAAGAIRRSLPQLRAAGIDIDLPTRGTKGRRALTITRSNTEPLWPDDNDTSPEWSSPSSPRHPNPQNPSTQHHNVGDDPGDEVTRPPPNPSPR